MKAILVLLAVTIYCNAFAQPISGMKLYDSGRLSIIGKPHCCNEGRLIETLKLDANGGFVLNGEIGIGFSPKEGSGFRTSWYPFKVAFRSGYADFQWNDANTGFYTWAGGYSTTAYGIYSFAYGNESKAMGNSSIAFGTKTNVVGDAGFAAGAYNEVNKVYGAALGYKSMARNTGSMAFGYGLVAKGYAGMVVGIYNDSLLTAEDVSSSTTTPLFVVGNGSSDVARANAMVVRKNGNVEVENLRVGGGSVVSRQQSGTAIVGAIASGYSTSKTFNFPVAFNGTPKVVATARSENGTNFPDVFVVTVRTISSTSVTFNIQRIDAQLPWAQQLQIDWIAWE